MNQGWDSREKSIVQMEKQIERLTHRITAPILKHGSAISYLLAVRPYTCIQ